MEHKQVSHGLVSGVPEHHFDSIARKVTQVNPCSGGQKLSASSQSDGNKEFAAIFKLSLGTQSEKSHRHQGCCIEIPHTAQSMQQQLLSNNVEAGSPRSEASRVESWQRFSFWLEDSLLCALLCAWTWIERSLFFWGRQSYHLRIPPLWPHLTFTTSQGPCLQTQVQCRFRRQCVKFGWVPFNPQQKQRKHTSST